VVVAVRARSSLTVPHFDTDLQQGKTNRGGMDLEDATDVCESRARAVECGRFFDAACV
jgi:hypothetical protein